MPPWGPLALALPLLKIDLTLASSGNSASPMKPNAFSHMITINLFNNPNNRQLMSFTMIPQNNFKGCFQRQRTKVKIYLSPPKKSESSKIAESLKFATNNHTICFFRMSEYEYE